MLCSDVLCVNGKIVPLSPFVSGVVLDLLDEAAAGLL